MDGLTEFGKQSSVLYIKNYTDGIQGIVLEDSPETTPPNTTTIQGDLSTQDFDPATGGIQTQTDTLGNVIVTDTPMPDREDTLNDRNLTAEQIANGEASFTDQYFADRAKILGRAKQLNAEGAKPCDRIDHFARNENQWRIAA